MVSASYHTPTKGSSRNSQRGRISSDGSDGKIRVITKQKRPLCLSFTVQSINGFRVCCAVVPASLPPAPLTPASAHRGGRWKRKKIHMYRKISIEANEYTKIDRWAKIKSKSEEIARVAQIALNLDTSTEEARLVEEIVLNLLREIRILREEQNREPRTSSSTSATTTSTTTSTSTSTTTASFRGSGGSDTSDHTDRDNDDNTRYDKDNPSLSSLSSLSTSMPLARSNTAPHSPASTLKLMANRSSSAPNSPPITILSDHYNPQFVQPYPHTFMQFSTPSYLPQDSVLLGSGQPLHQLHAPQFSQMSSFPLQPQTSSATQPPLPPTQNPHNSELSPISPLPPQPQKQKKRKSEKKPP